MGTLIIFPMTALLIIIFCPESPIWLLSKGMEEEARKALKRLRSVENSDIIQAEFTRIERSIKLMPKANESEETTIFKSIKTNLAILKSPSFFKPFSFLLVIFCITLEWSGFQAIAMYMVPMLKYVCTVCLFEFCRSYVCRTCRIRVDTLYCIPGSGSRDLDPNPNPNLESGSGI